MTNAPTVATKYLMCPKCTITSTSIYISGKNLRTQWSYAINQETVIGSNDPVQGTGEFRGTIEFEFIAFVDSVLHDLVTPSAGQIAETTLSVAEVDTTATPTTRTWVIKARLNEYQETLREADFVMGRIAGVLTDEPTEQ
uniref:Uncharacterized protein n=1 Tax=viral metagenome TaxID=1070528 RepID=A0A6M3IF35_9ZZZZ